MWLFLLLSHGCTVHYRLFQALGRALLSVVILDMHVNFELIVKPECHLGEDKAIQREWTRDVMPWTAALLQTCSCSHIHSASVAGTHKCCPGNNTTYPFGRSSVNSDTFYRSSSITSIVKCCTTPAICSSSNNVQCAPDPIPLSSSGVNRGSGLIETNPSSTDTDQIVLNTVNNAVQQVTS